MKKGFYISILFMFFVSHAIGQDSTFSHLLGVGNSAVFYQDWYGVPCGFAPHFSYIAKTPSSKFVWGLNLNFCYSEIFSVKSIRKISSHTAHPVMSRTHFWVDCPIYYRIAQNKHKLLFGLGPSYQFRDEERALTFGYGGEIRIDPNYYHHDLGINYSFHYLYDFSKHFMLGLICNANTFFKIPPSQKYLAENTQYSKYVAPKMASIGVNLFYKIK